MVLGPSPVKQTADRPSLPYLGMSLHICNSVSFLLLLLPAGSSSSSLLFAGFPSRPSEFNHLCSLGWVGAAHPYNPGTREWCGEGEGAACRTSVLSGPRDWDRMVLLHPLPTCVPLTGVHVTRNFPILSQVWVQDAATFPSPLQEEFLSTFLCLFCVFAGCGLLIAERYS